MSRPWRGRGLRMFKLEIDEELLNKFEETFCYASALGVRIRVRTLVSAVREAFLRGSLQMFDELVELRKIYGGTIYLTESGVEFAEVEKVE